MTRARIYKLLPVFVALLLTLLFQNCSNDVSFKAKDLSAPSVAPTNDSIVGDSGDNDDGLIGDNFPGNNPDPVIVDGPPSDDEPGDDGGDRPNDDICADGQIFTSGQCVCAGGSDWSESQQACVSCSSNQNFDNISGQCVDRCNVDQVWNKSQNQCQNRCSDPYAWNGTQCVVRDPVCNVYREITSQPFVVPPRSEEGVCYYFKISDAIASASSNPTRERRNDVKARDHEGGWQDATRVAPPRIMGKRELIFRLQGQVGERKVVLASDTGGTKSIKVDNFALVELYAGTETKYWAAGTSDAKYRIDNNTLGISVLNALTGNWDHIVDNFTSTASGGTATVEAVEFTPIVPVETDVTLRGSALDCGGAEHSSDVYLVFK
ncbi:MAG: hypothetical protein COT74_05365 [Bdellovibrionales bacterium CG10_big_fil_rev_8_21_14_0_10_45_34]|nr:MAG: hypothetical protein COT74_05365 [Bdellovibrionales bacterium CG10_big_fil_rev_8_21_14_0_10_45_34]